LLDESHQITGAAQESLLLMLEEPPKHVLYVLSTTEPEKIKVTIKRRCFCGELELLDRETIIKGLDSILKKEGIDDPLHNLLKEIAGSCEGSFGRALALLDSVIDIESEEEAIKCVSHVVTRENLSIDICRALISTDNPSEKRDKIRNILRGYNGEAEAARYAILGYLNKVLRSSNEKKAEFITSIILNFTDSFIYSGKAGLSASCLLSCIK